MNDRLTYLILFTLTVVAGLFFRYFEAYMPLFIIHYQSGIVWSIMMFWLVCAALPRVTSVKNSLAVIALLFFMQWLSAFHTGWFGEFVSSKIGNLFFGTLVSWKNLACIFIGLTIICFVRKSATRL